MDQAEKIMQCIITVARSLGIETEIDRRYPLNMDGQTEQAPSELPRVIVRSGSESAENANYKSWTHRWRMTPYVVVVLQDKDDPDSLRAEMNRVWLDFIRGLKASPLSSLIARNEAPDLSRDIHPIPGRPDVLKMEISISVIFERTI